MNLKVQILQYGDFEQIQEAFYHSSSICRYRHRAAIYSKQTLKQFEQIIEKDNPDVMMLPMNLFTKLSTEGKLKSLDSLIVKEKFDVNAVHKPVIDTLREAGGGSFTD